MKENDKGILTDCYIDSDWYSTLDRDSSDSFSTI